MNKPDLDDRAVIRPRPTKLAGVTMVIAGAVFLLFSIVPLGAAEGEARPFALAFGALWVIACFSFIAYGVYVIASNKPSAGVIFEVEGRATGTSAPPRGDIGSRLGNLEVLKNDRLITEEEYRAKRAEIMKEQW